MRLNFLEIHNVLSYGHEERIDFDDKLTALVGRNGAGKTNILRILTLVRDVIRRETMAPNTFEWNAMNAKIESLCPPHLQISLHSEIKLGVTLTTDEFPLEQSPDSYLIHLFLRGIATSALAEVPRTNDDFAASYVSNYDALDEMYMAIRTGVIVLRHNRTINASWTLAYDFEHDGKTYRWTLSHSPNGPYRGILTLAGLPTLGQPEDYKNRVSVTDNDDSSKVVNYGSMFPSEERGIYSKITQQLASFDSGSVWDELLRADLLSESPIMAGREPGLERVLAKVVADRIITDLDDLKLGTPATTNMEILASPNAPAQDIGEPVIPLYLSMLYRWSVGNKDDRDRYSTVQRIFGKLRGDEAYPELHVTATSNTHNIQFDHVVNDLTPERDQPVREYRQVQDYALTIGTVIRTNGREIPLAAIGSGGAELLRLATFLAADKYSVVLLDEPAAHLHPLAQENLLQFLRDGDAQYVFVTHAPGLLPTWSEGLGATIRVSLDKNNFSKAYRLSSNTIDQSDQLQRLVIAQPEVKSIPFAGSVIFVSGQTELIVYPRWLLSLHGSKSDAFPHFVNFNGDAQFPRYLRVAHLFGIPWAAIVDGKSFAPVRYSSRYGNGSNQGLKTRKIPYIAKQILEVVGDDPNYSQLEELDDFLDLLLSDKPDEWLASWQDKLQRFGVFTLSNCWHDKKKTTETCEKCKRLITLEPDNCEDSAPHPSKNHIESIENVVNNDDELAEINGKFDAQKAFELIENYPDPSDNFRALLMKVDGWFGSSSGTNGV